MYKSTVIILSLFLYITSFSQEANDSSNLVVPYYEAVDQWVIWNYDKEKNEIGYGFIYLDNTAGFTYNFEGRATLNGDTLVKKEPYTDASIKARIEPKTSPVTLLSKQQIEDLELPEVPEWLAIYKENENTIEYLKNEGYHYNHIGQCLKALIPLEKAYKIDPHYEGLEFEIAYAYNALKQYEKAKTILIKAIENNPNNYFFYRELGFAYRYLNKIELAETTYRKGISISDNDFQKSEMAVNMALHYFFAKDREKFDEWGKLTRKFSLKGEGYSQYIDYYEKEWDNDALRKGN